MRIRQALAFVLLTFFISCNPNQSLEQYTIEHALIGKWMMYKVYHKGKDITEEHNPEQSRWVKFAKNGQYASGGAPYEVTLGHWKLDGNIDVLEMSNGKSPNSLWKVILEGNELYWDGTGSEEMEKFRFILRRKDWKNS